VTDQRWPDDPTISRVLAAARAAAEHHAAAEDAVVNAFASAGPGPHDAGRLVAAAVRLAVLTAPAAPFAAMDPPDAEAVALVRLAGLDAAETGAVLGLAPEEVRCRLTRGLAAVRDGRAPTRAEPIQPRGAVAPGCPAMACA
jgi:DNA-directed RNA polymerase specialized sigma24 family protein